MNAWIPVVVHNNNGVTTLIDNLDTGAILSLVSGNPPSFTSKPSGSQTPNEVVSINGSLVSFYVNGAIYVFPFVQTIPGGLSSISLVAL